MKWGKFLADELHIDGWARASERPFLRRLDDIAIQVESRYAAEATDFLTPREQILAQSIAGYHNLKVSFWGGYTDAERKRALIAPSYWEEEETDYRISVLKVSLPEKSSITHRHIMGSLLGTGIKRIKVGDIGVKAGQAFVVVDAELVEYISGHWRLPGVADQVIQETARADDFPVSEYQIVNGVVSSMRLDAVVAHFCKYSRSKAQEAVRRGRVTLNFVEVTSPAQALEPGDVVSVRGFGRIKVFSLEGQSKRGKQRVQMGVLKS